MQRNGDPFSAPASRWPLPAGAGGYAVSVRELAALQFYAAWAAAVLEIGSRDGYSAVGMALAGATVTAVDPHDGRDGYPAGSLRRLRQLAADNGVAERVEVIVAPAEAWLPQPRRWGMAFVDGDHTEQAAGRDMRLCVAQLRPPAFLAVHDVGGRWPGVLRAVRVAESALELRLLRREGSLEVFSALRGEEPAAPVV